VGIFTHGTVDSGVRYDGALMALNAKGSPLRTLSREQARKIYDRIGSWQDAQAFYEDRAVQRMTEFAAFSEARRVVEFGCGTGRYAVKLLSADLSSSATYHGIDISPTMVALARDRLSAFSPRASVTLSDGSPPGVFSGPPFDRFVANYVLDLLAEDDIRAVLEAAHSLLEPGGRLCLTSLSVAPQWSSRFILSCWSMVRSIHPMLVGGCRPLSLLDYVHEPAWKILREERVIQFGVPSQVLVASRS